MYLAIKNQILPIFVKILVDFIKYYFPFWQEVGISRVPQQIHFEEMETNFLNFKPTQFRSIWMYFENHWNYKYIISVRILEVSLFWNSQRQSFLKTWRHSLSRTCTLSCLAVISGPSPGIRCVTTSWGYKTLLPRQNKHLVRKIRLCPPSITITIIPGASNNKTYCLEHKPTKIIPKMILLSTLERQWCSSSSYQVRLKTHVTSWIKG